MAFDRAPVGIAVVAADGSWVSVNPELCRLLGYDESALLASSFQAITHPDDLAEDLAMVERVVSGELPGYSMEKRYVRSDGSVLTAKLDVVAVREPEAPLLFLSQVQDIGPALQAEERLSRLALHDVLTDLPNRLLVRDRLEQTLARNRRSGRPAAIAFMDLDDFKLVNDTRGHSVGDVLLVRIARRMEQLLRPTDTLARFGGDEFVALFDGVEGVAEASKLAARLLGAMTLPFDVDGVEFTISASLGLVMAGPDAKADDLLRHADLAMYEAKRAGKGRLTVFEEALEHTALDRVETERSLRVAVEDDQLFPVYQPVVDLATGEVTGYESLVRWDRPGLGVAAARDFIAVAEAAHLLPAMTQALMLKVVDDLPLLGLIERGNLLLNVTPAVLSAPGMEDRLLEMAARLSAPGCLVLEVTESNVMAIDGSAGKVLKRLRNKGLRLAIDDFGTGYSTLLTVSHLEPDVIKIDQTFTDQLASTFPPVLIRAVCRIAEELDLVTVVEGVERPEQVGILRDLGCRYGQGYHLGLPARAAELGAAGIGAG